MTIQAAQQDEQDQTQAWIEYVVGCLKRGDTLHWAPTTGYVLHAKRGGTERVPWYVGAALRSAGTIVTDQPDRAKPQVWRLSVPPAPLASASRPGRH